MAVGVAAALVVEVVLAASVGPAEQPVLASAGSPAAVHRSAAAVVESLIGRRRGPRVTVSAAVSEGGEPVAGAEVSISDGSGPVLRTAVTGADGAVAFDDLEPGLYQLWATRGGRISPLARASASSDVELALALEPGTRIEGRAIAALALEPGSRAVAIPVDVDHAVFFADLDAGGHFSLDALPRGRWRLRLEVPGHVARREVLFEAGAEPLSLEVGLRPTGQVAGLVVDGRGAPVAGAQLVLQRRGGESAWRASADWALSPAGIRWVHPLAVMRHMPMRDARRFGAARPGTRPPECGGGHCGVDIGVERGSVVHAAAPGRVAAVVTDPNRLAGRFVAIEHDFGLKSFYMHLDEIRFDLEVGQRVAAGEPIGTLGSTGIVRSKPHLHFSVSQEIDGRPWFIDPEPMLHHAVVLPEPGSLARGAAPALVASADRRAGAAPPGLERIATDAEGRFRVEGLAAGTYVATAYHARLAPGTSAPFSVGSRETTGGVVIELADGAVIHGQVRAGDRPVAGARVLAEEGSGESRRVVARATTDATGRYELRPLAGALTVRALSREHGEAERALALEGAARREVSFELAIFEAELRGRVLSADGFPVARAAVRVLEGPPIASRQVFTDGSGRFSIAASSGGRYRLEVASPDHPPARATVGTNEDAAIALAAAGTISAEVRDAHTREPMRGVELVARGPGGARARAVTDARGVAELSPVAAGRWRLSVRAAGYTARSSAVRLEAGSRVEPTLELSRGAVLAGVLRDEDGVRVAGARVWVGSASTTTDADGRFRIDDAPTGFVEIQAEKGEMSGLTEIELAPGDELVTLELRIW